MLEEIDKEVAAAGRLQADRVGWGTERESEHAAAAMLMLFQIFLGLQLHPPPARTPPTIILFLLFPALYLSLPPLQSNPCN